MPNKDPDKHREYSKQAMRKWRADKKLAKMQGRDIVDTRKERDDPGGVRKVVQHLKGMVATPGGADIRAQCDRIGSTFLELAERASEKINWKRLTLDEIVLLAKVGKDLKALGVPLAVEVEETREYTFPERVLRDKKLAKRANKLLMLTAENDGLEDG